jgi:Xaa-Pro dipeptidase
MVSLDVYGHRLDELSPVVSEVRVYSEYPYTRGQPTLTWACRQVEEAGLRGKILGVEDNFTPLNDGLCAPWYQQIAAAFDGKVTPAGSLVNRLRMVKEPEEIELVRKACFYADELVRITSEELAEGRTEEEVGSTARSRVEAAMRAELPAIVPSLGTGRIVDGTPHAFHDTRTPNPEHTLRPGVPIIINCFATVGGYHGESERCGILGTPTNRQRALFEVAMESQLRALAAVRPGVPCGEVDLVAKNFIEQAGFDYLYGVGHGIGLLGHEPPWVREGSEAILEPGMCITVEPGLAVPG